MANESFLEQSMREPTTNSEAKIQNEKFKASLVAMIEDQKNRITQLENLIASAKGESELKFADELLTAEKDHLEKLREMASNYAE